MRPALHWFKINVVSSFLADTKWSREGMVRYEREADVGYYSFSQTQKNGDLSDYNTFRLFHLYINKFVFHDVGSNFINTSCYPYSCHSLLTVAA